MIKQFFEKYQPELVKLANLKNGRDFLGISHCPKDKRIVRVNPASYAYQISRNKLVYICRTYPLFAKRLQGAISKTDIVGVNKYKGLLHYSGLFEQPRLYPQIFLADNYFAGAGDGYVANTGTTYATVRNAETGNTSDYEGVLTYAQADFVDPTYYIYRAFFPINTSGITSVFVVTAADFYFFANTGTVGDSQSDLVSLIQTSQASNTVLATTDFDAVGSTKGATDIDLGSIVENSYNNFTLNATGIGWVNNAGFTKLGIRMTNRDLGNSAPTGTPNNINGIRTSETALTTSDPYLAVTAVLVYSSSVTNQPVFLKPEVVSY